MAFGFGSAQATSPLTDASHWLRGSGLEVLLLVLGSVLLSRTVRWAGERITQHVDQRFDNSDALVRSEATKHRHAVAQVLTYASIGVIYMLTGVLVVGRLGIPLSGLTAPAAAVGVALGLGGQRAVQDLVSGIFLVTERQYGFGDVIRLSMTGGVPAVTGTVEEVTLRITRMRTPDGEVVITPNGQIVQVTNLSRDWARAVVDVPLPSGTDLGAVSACLSRVGAASWADAPLRELLLDVPTVLGVESLQFNQVNLRMVARTLPGKQFDVGRELRVRVLAALHDEGFVPLVGIETAQPTALT